MKMTKAIVNDDKNVLLCVILFYIFSIKMY